MRHYLLREYGSWGVMLMAYCAGVVTAGRPSFRSLFLLVAIAFLINSKQALTRWQRSTGRPAYTAALVFFVQMAASAVLLLLLLRGVLLPLLPYAFVALSYIVLLRFRGEHFLLTEVAGFCLLSVAAVIAGYEVSGSIDHRLYAVVALYFTAGVFRVRVQLRRSSGFRAVMAFYPLAAVVVYYRLGVSPVILLPLLDNIAFTLTLYRVGIRTTGWIEVGKGLFFLVLLYVNYARLVVSSFA